MVELFPTSRQSKQDSFESNDFADKDILLSRSRYLAPATHSLRFYNEYFKPIRSYEIQKDRKRYLVRFEETEFFINLDTLTKPDIGKFVEHLCFAIVVDKV